MMIRRIIDYHISQGSNKVIWIEVTPGKRQGIPLNPKVTQWAVGLRDLEN